ncbi:MAG TPA: hypothetical protein VHX16_19015 [Chloroflexota bacterium]|jgi:hypothetical protein|nr:hypothetical protein [Chloroflexota bacterium]
MQQDPWPPIKGQTVRITSLYQTGVVEEVTRSGRADMYHVTLRTVGSVEDGGKVRWKPLAPHTCELDELEPFDKRD